MDISLLQQDNNDNTSKEFEEEDPEGGPYKKGNIIKVWGNKESMNLNSMILTNILQSPYYKNHLNELTTYYEVVDEIYYRVWLSYIFKLISVIYHIYLNRLNI